MLNELDRPCITAFITSISSQILVGIRITLRLMKPCSDSTVAGLAVRYGRSCVERNCPIQPETTRSKVLASSFFAELRERHDVDDVMFLVDGDKALNYACHRHGLDFRDEHDGNRNSAERIFREIKHRTSSFSNIFRDTRAETAN